MATKVAAIIFLLVGLAHSSRFVWYFNLVIGNWFIPLWVNGIAAIVVFVLSGWLLRSGKRNYLDRKWLLRLKEFCPKEKRIEIVSIAVTAGATVFMAITSYQSVKIGENVAKMTDESVKLSERLALQDLKRIHTELRPYLIIELAPGTSEAPGKNGKLEHLQKDGNSQLYFLPPSNRGLYLPFIIRNDGKVSAINIRAQYTSPAQSDIELGDKNNCSPGAVIPITFRPHINIAGNEESKGFEVVIRLTYEGLAEVDPQTYVSILRLKVVKRGEGKIYDIKESNFEFGFN